MIDVNSETGRARGASGGKGGRWLAVLAVGLIAIVWWMQRPGGPNPELEAKAEAGLDIHAPGSDPLILLGKMLIATKDTPELADMFRMQMEGGGLAGEYPEDQVRAVLLMLGAGQPDVPAAGRGAGMGGLSGMFAPKRLSLTDRLDKAEKTLAPDSPLRGDIRIARAALAAAESAGGGDAGSEGAAAGPADGAGAGDAAGSGNGTGAGDVQDGSNAREGAVAKFVDGLSAGETEGLRRRHGWFAEVFLTAAEPDAPVRTRAEGQMAGLFIGGFIVGGVVGLAALAGFVLLIVAVVLLAQGRMRSGLRRQMAAEAGEVTSGPGRGVWLETVCVFAGGFLALKVGQIALVQLGVGEETITWVSLLAQWSLVTAIFWPVARGMSWREWRRKIGWGSMRPERGGAGGVMREIGCGILGYLFALPIMFATAILVLIIAVIIQALTGEEPVSARQINRVQELVGGGSVWMTVTVFLLAVVWAPVVEESIFRGALFRHLRGWAGAVVAGLLSALAFAAMHPYMVLQMIVVGSLGLTFALMREWRGSIIPSATAHFIQNTFALTMMLLLSPMMHG